MGRPPSGGARGLDRGRRGRVGPPTAYTPAVTRDELIDRTRRLIAEGDRLAEAPSLDALRAWLQLSDETLAEAWGSMDRYHLAWLSVGKPKEIVRGRPMSEDEEAAYVREVARQKTAALRMSLDAVERQGMPFRGESGGVGAGQQPVGAGQAPVGAGQGMGDVPGRARFEVPSEADELAARVRQAREEAARHDEALHRPRAPRPEKMQR
jgi:hypothetical protein